MVARFDDTPLPYSSSKPLPTRQPTRGASVKRSKTLTRPERSVAPVPLIAPPTNHFSDDPAGAGSGNSNGAGSSGWFGQLDWWILWTYATTFWAPPVVLGWFGIKEKQSRQAWREKITLCWIAVLLGGVVGFATMGLQRALCPSGEGQNVYQRLGSDNCE